MANIYLWKVMVKINTHNRVTVMSFLAMSFLAMTFIALLFWKPSKIQYFDPDYAFILKTDQASELLEHVSVDTADSAVVFFFLKIIVFSGPGLMLYTNNVALRRRSSS